MAALIMGDFELFHMNLWIRLFRRLLMVGGIPWTRVRNWVRPPTTMETISLCPSMEGWTRFHRASAASMRSTVGVQTAVSFTPLPTKAPRTWVGSPSLAILVPGGIGSWDGWRRLVCMTRCRWDGVPTGIRMVFWVLNLAPDAWHHLCRMSWRAL